MSVVLISLACLLGLALCFASYSVKRKPYLYARNAIIVAFGALFLLTLLFDTESLQGCGFEALYTKFIYTTAWWQIILKIIVPIIVALTTIFLAELPQKAYEITSSVLIIIPMACGLYITPNASKTTILTLSVLYGLAMIAVGIFMFRTYLCVETALVGGFLVAWLLKRFYALSNVIMFVIAGVLTLAGSALCIYLAARKDKRQDKPRDKRQDEKASENPNTSTDEKEKAQ